MTRSTFYTIGSIILGLFIAWPLFNNQSTQAISVQNIQKFVDLPSAEKNFERFQDIPAKVEGELQKQLSKSDIDLDVEAIRGGDLSSIKGDTPAEVLRTAALVNESLDYMEQEEIAAEAMAEKSARLFQIRDLDLANSITDAAAIQAQLQAVVDKMNQATDTIETLMKGITLVLSAKPAFMPEKPDTDTFPICTVYMPGGLAQLYPSVLSGIPLDIDVADLAYENIAEYVSASANLENLAGGKLEGLSDRVKEYNETGNFKALLEQEKQKIADTAQEKASSGADDLKGLVMGISDAADKLSGKAKEEVTSAIEQKIGMSTDELTSLGDSDKIQGALAKKGLAPLDLINTAAAAVEEHEETTRDNMLLDSFEITKVSQYYLHQVTQQWQAIILMQKKILNTITLLQAIIAKLEHLKPPAP